MQLTIRVGAAVDRSLSEAFRPLVEAAGKAKVSIEKSEKARQNTQSKTEKSVTDDAEKWAKYRDKIRDRSATYAGKLAVKQAAEEMRAASKAAKAEAAEAEKLAKQRSQIRDRSAIYAGKVAAKQAADEIREEEKKTKAYERELAKQNRAHEQAARQRFQQDRAKAQWQNKASDSLAASSASERAAMAAGGKSAAGMAGRGLKAAGGFALGIGGDLARGAGVETDFGAIAQKNFALQEQAQNIANSGYMAGDARNGMRVNANSLASDAMRVGKSTGNDANDAMTGLEGFVSKTGDLATGRDILESMARLSKATGTNLGDMMAAAGGVAMAMGDTEDKGAKLNAIMNGFAAQGKLGAVEIKDLSKQMDKLSAQAGQYEGNLGDNMAMLGALAQSARKGGGATNATQAATSVAAFTSMLKTPKRAEEFEKATGQKVFNKQGMLRNPEEIIIGALRSKGMSPTEFKTIFANMQGGRAVEESATIYRQAGGGAAGEAAVRANFEQLKKASIDAAEAAESFALAMKQPKSQAEVFNQTMRETTMRMQNELTPALVALAPAVIEAAKAAAEMVAWLTGKSPVEKKLEDTKRNVDSVIAANQKGMATGDVNPGQQALNYKASADAIRTYEAAKAETQQMKAKEKLSTGGAIATGLYDNSAAGMIFRAGDAMLGSGKGNGIGGTIRDSRHQDTVAAEGRQGQADEYQKKMLVESEKLTAYLTTHTLSVKIVEGGAPAGPPGIDPAGRTPPP